MSTERRGRRALRRACLAGAATCFAVALVPGAADAQAPDEPVIERPDVFSGSARALAASVQLDRAGLLPVPDLFRFIVADGAGTYQPSEQRGRASVLYPGQGAVIGPSLACSQFPPEARPVFGPILDACNAYSFPLSVVADSLDPDESTEGSAALGSSADPLSAQGVGARTHAAIDAVTTEAEVNDVRLLGAPAVGPLPAVPGFEDLEPYLVSIGSSSAITDQRIDVDGALVTEATSAVNDVGLVGGLIRIGSVVSHTRIVDAVGTAEGDPATEASMDVSGVTVAGVPATITDEGLRISEASQPLSPLLAEGIRQLEAMLSSISFRTEPTPTEQGVDEDGIAFARVGGLLVEFGVPVDGLPPVPGPLGDIDLNGEYVGSVLLGEAGVRALADSFDRAAPTPVGSGGGGGATSGGSTGGGASTAGGLTPARPTTGSGAPAAPPVAGAPAAPEAVGGLPIDDLLADRLPLLYLAFTLAAIAACLAPRLTLPARLPRSTA